MLCVCVPRRNHHAKDRFPVQLRRILRRAGVGQIRKPLPYHGLQNLIRVPR